jgi:cysteine-rich repeat protein
MKSNAKIWLSLVSLILILAIGSGIYFSGIFPQATVQGTTKYAIPHMASFRCEPIGDKYGLQISVPINGIVISKSNVGSYTNGISNIKLSFANSYWSTDWATRVSYATCDTNGNNCGNYQYLTDWVGGTKNLPIHSIDFSRETLKLLYERIPLYLIGGWKNSEGLQVSYDLKNFGLRLYSTTRDPAGSKICTTSCDLSCPDIGYREKLIATEENTLDFYETAPYLEYWESIDYDLNAQGGATIYNSATNKFCFAGAIYTGSTLKMENGVTYIYPDTNTREVKECCAGATISSTYSDKICGTDYKWKTIKDTDKLTCMSDYNCPAQGGVTCQNKILSGYHCVDKDENNVGLCQKESGTSVGCCLNSDCNRDMVCDLSTHTCKGGTPNPTCGDNVLDAGEQCDDGNTIGGDGCSSICELEIDCDLPENKENALCIIDDGKCEGHWYFLGLDGLLCKIKAWFISFITPLKWVLIIVGGLVSGLASMLISRKFMLDLDNKKQWIFSSIIGLVIGLAVGVLAFYYWWVALLGLVIFGILKIFI